MFFLCYLTQIKSRNAMQNIIFYVGLSLAIIQLEQLLFRYIEKLN